jgi:hypothetical protein
VNPRNPKDEPDEQEENCLRGNCRICRERRFAQAAACRRRTPSSKLDDPKQAAEHDQMSTSTLDLTDTRAEVDGASGDVRAIPLLVSLGGSRQ